MRSKAGYRQTVAASIVGYITQAACINFLPLLFVTFNRFYGISLPKLTSLITVCFITQLLIDWFSTLFAGRIKIRQMTVGGLLLCSAGMGGLSFLPQVMGDPYIGLLVCVVLYSIGGGFIEVMISPIVENCPTKNKSAMMSLLHSFYSWGSLVTILFSTLFFTLFGVENYRVLALLWAAVPLVDAIWFCFVPIYGSCEEERGGSILKEPRLWLFLLIIFCAGACEQAMSQWASAFAEETLNVSKTVGDLAGPCAFALLMGVARLLYSFFSNKVSLYRVMLVCSILCVGCYLLAALSPMPVFGLIGCALCGFSVGVMWPGTISMASASVRGGKTGMFALLALAGDVGCTAGPALVGFVSAANKNSLSAGLLAGTAIPLLLTAVLVICRKSSNSQKIFN